MQDEDFEQNPFPRAYLVTFRTYGTWIHGSEKYSVSDSQFTNYGLPKIAPSPELERTMQRAQKGPSAILTAPQRTIVNEAIIEVCRYRDYGMDALNVRSNHVHAVVSAQQDPDKIAGEFKAYATRALKMAGEFTNDAKIWARGASTRYLWKDRHVAAAVDYVKYCQEDVPFEFRESWDPG